jgi:hypothetical protein
MYKKASKFSQRYQYQTGKDPTKVASPAMMKEEHTITLSKLTVATRTRPPAKIVYRKCAYCGVRVDPTAYERHIGQKCKKRTGMPHDPHSSSPHGPDMQADNPLQ